MAGLELHRLILKHTKASRDQEHLRIIHMSCPDMVEDRTKSLLSGSPEKPARAMADIIMAGTNAAGHLDSSCIAGIPCNTFHAQPIWNEFANVLAAKGFSHPVLNMVEETISHIRKHHGQARKIGILSTTGTRKFAIYSKPLELCGFQVLESKNQEITHTLIYDPDWGIKARAEVSEKAKNLLKEQISELANLGADAIILGCTELPLAIDQTQQEEEACPLLNPMDILARNLVHISLKKSSKKTDCLL
ncbi:MAG: hypothetical protein CSA18_00825 [Deltaproteobacteria bacterium]|nr:MAG: hypothetical protein CSA18_00825 [Deltaproteobacteria bacterium]